MASAVINKIIPLITSSTALKVGVSIAALASAGAVISSASGSASKTPSIFVVKPLVSNKPTAAPTPTPTPTPAPTPTLSAKPGFQLGVNLGVVSYWSGERSFANLLTGSNWIDPAKGWAEVSEAEQDRNGNMLVSAMPAGREVVRILTPPPEVLNGSDTVIRCTWEGTGTVGVSGNKWGQTQGDHSYEFTFSKNNLSNARAWLTLRDVSASDPVRNLDCREKGMARGDLFTAEFLDSLKPFGVLRFLDWSAANYNQYGVKWADRTLPGAINQSRIQGPALEHLVALSNATSAEPWVTVPWNADDDYLTRMAQLLHDGIPANRRVYVETSNEVWNYSFSVAHQAQAEGLAAKLSDNGFIANLRRYAERTNQVMKIWAKVFADRPGQLVRVAATQHGNPWTAEMVLGSPGLADNIDALATAPYFGNFLFDGALASVTDTGRLLSELAGDAKKVLANEGEANATLARKYGKRYIAYEAGQHLIEANGQTRLGAMNRSNGMYDIYVSYITDWKTRFNDTMVLYATTSPISGYGAWGLREYSGQPLSETPKRRAAIAMGRK